MCPLSTLLWRKTLTKLDQILLFSNLLWQGRGPIFFWKFQKISIFILIPLIKYLKTTRHVYLFSPIIIISAAYEAEKQKAFWTFKIDQGAIENRRNYFKSPWLICAIRLIRFNETIICLLYSLPYNVGPTWCRLHHNCWLMREKSPFTPKPLNFLK